MTDELRAARQIAAHIFALGGPDLRGMPDDKLLQTVHQACRRMATTIRQSGLTADEATKSFDALSAALGR